MKKDIIKFLTAGNVDDGKSTLIGRMLYDTNSLYEDQIAEVKKFNQSSNNYELDFSLFLDGLSSERAQKITIDVAYRYFFYANKKFIIADSPGHEEYTRNMAVGASNSDSIIILIDATKGIKTQTIRHSYIAHLFGIKKVIVAVNKMDLVNYDYEKFDEIRKKYLESISSLDFDNVYFVPIVATLGTNIVRHNHEISWYHGKSILEYLLVDDFKKNLQNLVRFQVQNVIKDNDIRHYQGILSSGNLKLGDELIVYPEKNLAKISKILHNGNEVASAKSGSSLSINIDKELNIERGSLIANTDIQPQVNNKINSYLIWFSNESFFNNSNYDYSIKFNHKYYRIKIDKINYIIDVNKLSNSSESRVYNQDFINLNQISNVDINISHKIAFDLFKENKSSGSFLLINNKNNETIGCGLIEANISNENNKTNRDQEFINELSILVKKYFSHNNNNDFSI